MSKGTVGRFIEPTIQAIHKALQEGNFDLAKHLALFDLQRGIDTAQEETAKKNTEKQFIEALNTLQNGLIGVLLERAGKTNILNATWASSFMEGDTEFNNWYTNHTTSRSLALAPNNNEDGYIKVTLEYVDKPFKSTPFKGSF